METYRTNHGMVEAHRGVMGSAEVVLVIVSVAGFVRGLGEIVLSGGCGAEGTLALLVAVFATREILTRR